MKTKYIKVSVSEKLPDKEGRYFLWVDNPNARNLNSQKISTEYNMERHFFKNGQFQTFYDTTHWLKEVPDYEDEILAMLERMKINIVFTSVRGFDKPLTLEEVDRFSKDVDDLIEKIKHGKVS